MNKNNNKKIVVKFLHGIADDKEKQELYNSPESENMLKEQWENFDQAKSKYGEMDHAKLKAAIFEQIKHKKQSKAYLIKFTGFLQKYAAAILIPLFAAGVIYFFFSNPDSAVNLKMVEKSNPRGVRSEILLSDGSKIWLNADSRISYPEKFTGDSRIVYLIGEAFFDVKKNLQMPFIVKTTKIDIEVLGTRFNVKSYTNDNDIETTLESGKVSVKRVNPETGELTQALIEPNQQVQYNIKTQKFSYSNVDAGKYSSWIEGKLIIDAESFDELVLKLERWYNVDINLQKDLSKKYNFTLTITDETIGEVINLIGKTTPGLKIDYKGSIINIAE